MHFKSLHFHSFIHSVTQKLCEIGCKLVSITNRKSHMSFRLVPKSVTLNDIMALILCYFTGFGSFFGPITSK